MHIPLLVTGATVVIVAVAACIPALLDAILVEAVFVVVANPNIGVGVTCKINNLYLTEIIF